MECSGTATTVSNTAVFQVTVLRAYVPYAILLVRGAAVRLPPVRKTAVRLLPVLHVREAAVLLRPVRDHARLYGFPLHGSLTTCPVLGRG